MKRNILFIVILFFNFITLGATYTTFSSGNWSTGSTWIGGTSPNLTGGNNQLSDDVVIDAGHNVTLTGDLTVKSGITLIVRGNLTISGDVDFQNGCTILVESSGVLELNGLNNSNNSTNVSIHGLVIVNGDYSAGNGAQLSGGGSMEVSGTSSGNGTTFGTVLTCSNCDISSGWVIDDCIIEDNQTAEHTPIEPYWNWTYSQQIYYQSEINQEGNITSLSFRYNGWSSFTDEVEVYLTHTSKTDFDNTNDWVDYSDLTKVFDGDYSVSNVEDWYEITFDTPFYYNNVDNLVIAVFEKTDGYHSSSDEFYTADGSVYRVLTYYDDYTKPDPVSPPTADYRSKWIPSLKLNLEPAGSPLPITLTYFTGEKIEESAALLKWQTVSEKNNDYFTIEKSVDGYAWNNLDIIHTVNGNSQSVLNYSTIDKNPKEGINYYKLSQTDFDGEIKFLGVVALDFGKLQRNYIKAVYNLLGQKVNKDFKGPKLIMWDNGDVEKIFN